MQKDPGNTSPNDHPLNFIFSQADTSLLSSDRERQLSESLWISRRRLEILLGRAGNSKSRRVSLPRVLPHRRPLSPQTVKGLLAAERDARQRKDGSRAFRKSIDKELGRIDEAKDELVRGNLRLVVWTAKKFVGKGLELSDLFQEGAISLLEAAARFDPARGTRLSTYATRAIQLGIVRALADKGRMVRVPLYRLKEVIEATSVWKELRASLGREPTEEEVSSRLGVTRERLSELAPALRATLSTDGNLPGTELTFSQVLADERLSPFERAASSEARVLVHKALANLPPRECRILKLRYGIGESDEQSFEAIGEVVGLSRERSRQLERNVLQRIRAELESGAPPAGRDASRASAGA